MRLKITVLILFFITFIVSAGFAGIMNWETVNQNGLGNANNTIFYPGTVFNSYFFIGSGNGTGGQLWRSSDGNNFSSVTTDGFGDTGNITIIPAHQPFEGYMYAFTENTGAAEGWRSTSGSAGDWTAVFSNGFGNPDNDSIVSSCVWNNWLYVGIYNSYMGENVRRTDNGTSWILFNPGFNVMNNSKSYPEGGYNGYLYCGTHNSVNEGELWRYSSSWKAISTTGFGDANNKKILPTYQGFNGYLYAGTENDTGAQIWRSTTGNSNTWIKIFDFTANDSNNQEILSFSMPIDGYLYFSTRNSTTGTEVWKTPDGNTWEQVNTDGFGSSNNTESWLSRTLLNDYLYAGTVNSSGAHIYKVHIEKPDDPIVTNEGEIIVIGSTEGKGTINPDKGDKVTIHFKGAGEGKFTCRIFTLLGKLIYEKTINSISKGNFTWVPGDIASGTYIVHVKGPGIDVSKKIAILR